MRLDSTVQVALLLLASCASAPPPPELVNARSAYARASRGPAAQVVPDELHKARVALNTAEQSFADDPESQVTRDMAYIAERKAQLAEAKGGIALSGKDAAAADKQFKQTLSDQKDEATRDADRSRQEAARSEDRRRVEAAEHATAIGDEQARTDAEKVARVTAETKNQALMNELALLGQLKEEERGTVITLSGDVIFVSGKASLLPAAQPRLDKLADALRPTTHRMVIEGHTDSRGSDALNQELSTRRAYAVRDYLISRGITTDRIQVNGFGRTRPIADNDSAEGRAMNRRVEIIVAGMRTARE